MKIIASIFIVAILTLTIFVTPVSASTPLYVNILSEMSTWPEGTFEASGPAVDAGIVCPGGTVIDVSASATGGQSSILILFVHKHFICEDSSGTFEMDLNVRIASSGTTARRLVVSGSGEYESLRGEGGLYATYTDTGLIDTYTGKLDIH